MGLLDIASGRSSTPPAEVIAALDLTNTSSRVDLILAASIVSIIFVSLIVSLRIYARVTTTGRLFPDDVLMIIAAICSIVLCTSPLAALRYGLGKHIWLVDMSNIQHDIQKIIQLLYVDHIFQQFTLLFTKLSILSLYQRLFPSRGLRRATYALGIICILYYTAAVFLVIFQCIPVQAAWTFDDPHPKCFDFIKFLYASASVNIVTDIIICIMPIKHFYQLQLPKKQKIVLYILFMGGGVACIAAIMRITVLNRLYSLDFTFAVSKSLFWSNIECTIAIICTSVPAIRPLFTRMFPTFMRTTRITTTARDAGASKDVHTLSAVSRRTKPTASPKDGHSVMETIHDWEEDDLSPSLKGEEAAMEEGRAKSGSLDGPESARETVVGDSTEELRVGRGELGHSAKREGEKGRERGGEAD